jgi:phosphoribosylglycinamide formyltransferase-1
MSKKSIVILISGNGSNLQAFINAQKSADFNGEIVAVISNKKGAFGLQRAANANIATTVIQNTHYASRALFDQALASQINQYNADFVILAGFMRILTPQFVNQFYGKLLNIHPSLLPKYPGLHTHKRALENNDEFHGTSVHFVTEELDGGPVIAQAKTKLETADTIESVLSKIQKLEHKLYPNTVKMLLNDKIELKKEHIYFEQKQLKQPILL